MNRWARLATTVGFFCMVFSGVTPAWGQASNPLRWKWNAGDMFLMEIEQDVTTIVETSGRKVTTLDTTRTWMTWEVTESDDDGTGTVQSKVDRITMDSVQPSGIVRFDSDDDTDDPEILRMVANLKPMVGGTSTQKISNRGEVLEVKIGDELKTSLTEIGGKASIKMFQDIARNGTLVLPEKPLEKGDSWEKESVTTMPGGDINLLTTYTYQGETTINNKILHRLNVDVTMKFGLDATTIERQETNGAIYFDAVSGRMDHSRVELDIEMTVLKEGRPIKVSLKQVVIVNISEK